MRLRTRLAAAAAAAGVLALFTFRGSAPVQMFTGSAQRFVSYYRALDASPNGMGAWEKLLYSLALANAASRSASSPEGGADPQSLNARPTSL